MAGTEVLRTYNYGLILYFCLV